MKKILFIPLAFVLGISFILTSCLNNDDDDNTNQEWLIYQASVFQKVAADKVSYDTLVSQTGNGFIMWKDSTFITTKSSTRISADGYPQFTDTVVVRYDGWYLYNDKNNKQQKYIFDSTEQPSTGSFVNPNKVPRQFAVNGVIEGWTTALQKMKIGEEKLVVIPQNLGYGSYGNSSATTTIPGYTTLWFNIKLVNIIPMKTTKN